MHSSASELKGPALCNARELVPLVSVIEGFHYMCIWPELKAAHNTVVFSCYTVSQICSLDLSFTAQRSTYSKYVRTYVRMYCFVQFAVAPVGNCVKCVFVMCCSIGK